MGLLIIGVVAGILIAFGLAPSAASLQECGPQGCLERAAASPPIAQQSMTVGPYPATTGAKSATATKSRKPSLAKSGSAKSRSAKSESAKSKSADSGSAKSGSAKSAGRSDLVQTAHATTRTDASATYRSAESPDPVLDKAKISIAAKMEDPASAEFGDMKRAFRMSTLGRPMDTICGHVRGKNASGTDTGERPFLYLVKEDDAYVVTGKADSAAAIAYRNICN
jgi:hypothetical protein